MNYSGVNEITKDEPNENQSITKLKPNINQKLSKAMNPQCLKSAVGAC